MMSTVTVQKYSSEKLTKVLDEETGQKWSRFVRQARRVFQHHFASCFCWPFHVFGVWLSTVYGNGTVSHHSSIGRYTFSNPAPHLVAWRSYVQWVCDVSILAQYTTSTCLYFVRTPAREMALSRICLVPYRDGAIPRLLFRLLWATKQACVIYPM